MKRRPVIRHFFETVTVRALMTVFAVLPVQTASGLGGLIGRGIGPMTGIHRKAKAQMARINPDWSPQDIDRIACGVWDNLGRVFAEYPHLKIIARDYTTVDNQSGLDIAALADRPVIFVAGHFANWEVPVATLWVQGGQAVDSVYRPANNPGVDRWLGYYRSLRGVMRLLPTSVAGMRAVVEGLRDGRKVGILVDQKYTQGIMADFFGIPATSTTVYAQLGARFDCPVIPVQIVRQKGARFNITLYPPLKIRALDGSALPMDQVVREMHGYLYGWMRAHPEQWLWVHQRWPKE